MKVVFSRSQLLHEPQLFFVAGALQPHPECPERAIRLRDAAMSIGLPCEEPVDYGLDLPGVLHSSRYLHYLQTIFPRWTRIDGGADEVVPGIQPDRRNPNAAGAYPASATGQAGFHHIDLSSPINTHTWTSALWSANAATHAAALVGGGESCCYAVSRPPGHHAGREFAAGFCYLGNTAIAAEFLRQHHDRVAVIDVDVHHGNGTQDIFYERDDVLTVSIHADPVRFYPFFWGYAGEFGAGDGEGANLNIPLARGTDDIAYLRELDGALDRINNFSAGALVIALGLDAYEGDPMLGFAISSDGFRHIGRRIGELKLPTVLVQEGGYLSDELGVNLRAFLEGFMSSHGE